MSTLKYLHWTPEAPVLPAGSGARARSSAAHVLRSASALLARLARRIGQPQPVRPASADPRLEFYAEAGAPEGALYLDGRYVGRLDGVSRL